jgi:uncharacterized membrane protein
LHTIQSGIKEIDMSQLVVATFADTESAEKALEAVQVASKNGAVSIADYAVIEKNADGVVSNKNRVSSSTAWGAGIGAAMGGLLMFMFPVAGIAIGAGGGALIGKSIGDNVDQEFVRQVQDGLAPGSSALFLLVRGGDGGNSSSPRAIVAALEPFQGTLYQTTFSSELEEQLKDALK